MRAKSSQRERSRFQGMTFLGGDSITCCQVRWIYYFQLVIIGFKYPFDLLFSFIILYNSFTGTLGAAQQMLLNEPTGCKAFCSIKSTKICLINTFQQNQGDPPPSHQEVIKLIDDNQQRLIVLITLNEHLFNLI